MDLSKCVCTAHFNRFLKCSIRTKSICARWWWSKSAHLIRLSATLDYKQNAFHCYCDTSLFVPQLFLLPDWNFIFLILLFIKSQFGHQREMWQFFLRFSGYKDKMSHSILTSKMTIYKWLQKKQIKMSKCHYITETCWISVVEWFAVTGTRFSVLSDQYVHVSVVHFPNVYHGIWMLLEYFKKVPMGITLIHIPNTRYCHCTFMMIFIHPTLYDIKYQYAFIYLESREVM